MPPKGLLEKAKAVATSVANKFKKRESADVTNPDYRPLGQEDDSPDASEHDGDGFQDIDLDSPTGTIQRDPPVSREDDIYLDAAHQINGVLSFRDIEEEEKAAFKADIRSRVNVILRHNAALYQKQIAKMKQEMKKTVVTTDASSVGYGLTNNILDLEKDLKSVKESNAGQLQKIEHQSTSLQSLRNIIAILETKLGAYEELGSVSDIKALKDKIDALKMALLNQAQSLGVIEELLRAERIQRGEVIQIQVEAVKKEAARDLLAKDLVLTAMKGALEEELFENQEDSRAEITVLKQTAEELRKAQEKSQAVIDALKQDVQDQAEKARKASEQLQDQPKVPKTSMALRVIGFIIAVVGVVIGLIPALFTFRSAKKNSQEKAKAKYKKEHASDATPVRDEEIECVLNAQKPGSFLGFYVGLGNPEYVPEYTARPVTAPKNKN